jgi:hypothetical protein
LTQKSGSAGSSHLAHRAGLAEPDFAATVQASAALGAVSQAVTAWAERDHNDLIALIDAAFAAVEAGVRRI